MSDLFTQNYQAWQTNPQLAFESWLAAQDFRKSSANVYASMWAKFLGYLAYHEIKLARLDSPHIADFLDANGLLKQHRARYIRLIERVFLHLNTLRSPSTNPGSQAAQRQMGVGDNDPTAFFSTVERTRLSAFLTTPSDSDAPWKVVRDHALTALAIGAGIKVGDLCRLTVNCIDLDDGWITLPGTGPSRPHRAQVLPFAQDVTRRWLARRRDIGAQGSAVFPSDLLGRHLHPATVFRRILHVLDDAGLRQGRAARASPQTLRNSYAAELFDAGHTNALVTEYLGLHAVLSARRLRAAYEDWTLRHGPAPCEMPNFQASDKIQI